MEMVELTTFQLPDEIVQPFTICNVGDTLVVSAKEHTFVLQLKFRHFVDEGAISHVLSRIKCSTVRPTGQLLAHEPSLYIASEIEQRKQIMLDQTIFPNIAKVYISNVQSWVSPPRTFQSNPNEHLVANLTNMGQLTIYRQEEEWVSNWNLYVDVSAWWLKYVYDGRKIETFQQLQTMVDDILITCFSWQDNVHQYPLRFAFCTKSGKIVLCNLCSSEVTLNFVHQQPEAAFVIKYVSMSSEEHFLLAGLRSGRVIMYRFETLSTSESFEFVGTFFDEDLVVTSIECEADVAKQRLLLLVTKGSFLLVLNACTNGTVLGSATLNLEHFMITGLQQLKESNYVVSTMEGAIFMLTIDPSSDGAVKLRHQEIKSDLNVGSYALYGVAATRTRSCWMFLGYPSKRFDHLSLRSPTCIFFAKFGQRDAIQILQTNATLKMDGYYDAAEVVRYHGHKNTESLKGLERVDLKPELNDACAYQLKLQLIHIGAKMTYHSRRNMSTTEILHNQFQFLCTIIEVISACKALLHLGELAQRETVLNPAQQNAVLCLRNFIRSIAEDTFTGDYEYMHVGLKAKLEDILQRTANMQMQASEECSFCDVPIPPGKSTCAENHPVFRCVLTKIQIPLDDDSGTCEMCQRYSVMPSVLASVFGDEAQYCPIDYGKCCVCDIPFQIKN